MIFKNIKDTLLDYVDRDTKTELKYPLFKVGKAINNYRAGDFIVVGGRKTSGKGYFLLNNYIISPLLQKEKANKFEDRLDVNILYFSTKRSMKLTIERMIVNYFSQKDRGSKLSISDLYGYNKTKGGISKAKSKAIIISALKHFNMLEKTEVIDVFSGKKTVDSLRDIIHDKMERYGSFSSDWRDFIYKEEYKHHKTIIVIDDASGVVNETGGPALKNLTAVSLGMALREYATILNVTIVLSVPSDNTFFRDRMYKGYLNTISPYDHYADRVLLLHNPVETSDESVFDYKMSEFRNEKTGINYFRFLHIASNYMGPSGIILPLFLFPENGYFKELPKADDDIKLDPFFDIVLDRSSEDPDY